MKGRNRIVSGAAMALAAAVAILAIAVFSSRIQEQFEPNDMNYANESTCSELIAWGADMASIIDGGVDDCTRYRSLEELVANWKRIGCQSFAHDTCDFWGNAYRMEVLCDGGERILRITSKGSNRIDESGNGDDLWVAVHVSTGSRPGVRRVVVRCMKLGYIGFRRSYVARETEVPWK
jgi:hypothetical protein